MENKLQEKQEKKEKLWTPSFLILWQGQLVSTMGDAIYSIALGFWVLSVTGSTALMGTLMAASTLPGVLVSPFAGVLIDRCNRKRIFILMDMLRAVCIILLAVAAYRGFLAIWMVFAAGIILSVCGAVFGPGIQSTVPDLVPKSKITKNNGGISTLFKVD
jgi:MFS family permease